MAAAADRLSALANDLLEHILSFAPPREAAASAILSRRWRPLWRRMSNMAASQILAAASSYPANLWIQSPSSSTEFGRAGELVAHWKILHTKLINSGYYTRNPTFDAFFRDGNVALQLRGGGGGGKGLERLTLFLEVGAYRLPDTDHKVSLHDAEPEDDARVAGLLTAPAASQLKQLIIACQHHHFERHYFPPLAWLPCAAMLRGIYLQVVVDVAPALTSLALVNVSYKPRDSAKRKRSFMYVKNCFGLPLRLRCPTVTDLVLRTYLSEEELKTSIDVGIELDMPCLSSFRYQGHPVKLSLISPPPGLERVHLDDTCHKPYVAPVPRVLTSFSSTRVLKISFFSIENIVADGVILPTFPDLEFLELEGNYEYRNSKTAEAVVGLLRSCPAMSELRLRLDMQHDYHYEQKTKNALGGPFGESMDRFERLASMSAAHRSAVELGQVSEIPAALTNNGAFRCLETSLRKITLQFKAKEVNCFQVQLAKFLVENAMVLEEMHIEDGSQFWPDHLCHKVPRWRAESFRRKNLPVTAAGFRVYQLPNPVVDSN
ncbi:unnamed protein product [Alopecurus aequalis]